MKNTINREKKYLSSGIQAISSYAEIVMDYGKGSYLFDTKGKKYVDFAAGICVNALGHAHPEYTEALKKQLDKVTVGSFTTEVRTQLVELLAKITPGELNVSQFFSSGTEATESALRLAKSYTGKEEYLSFWGSFHGKTMGVLGLMGSTFKQGQGPFIPGCFISPYPDELHFPFHIKDNDISGFCLDFLREKIQYETSGNLAAIIIEPIQGTNGNIIPPKNFLKELKKIAQENKALLICDEMITGFARTGKMFGSEQFDVIPDIMTIGKGFGNGFPVTGVLSTQEIMSAKPYSEPSYSSSSYGGNPLASAAALASTSIIIKDKLDVQAKNNGEFLLQQIQKLAGEFSFIKNPRGMGLLAGFDLIDEKNNGKPLNKDACIRLFKIGIKNGIIAMLNNPRVRINPPLTISQETISEGIEILRKTFKEFTDEN